MRFIITFGSIYRMMSAICDGLKSTSSDAMCRPKELKRSKSLATTDGYRSVFLPV